MNPHSRASRTGKLVLARISAQHTGFHLNSPALKSIQRHPGTTTVLALILLTTLVYWPGLSGDFLFDDFPNIITNPLVHLQSLDLVSLRRAALGYQPGEIGRPLATLSFAANWYLGGKDAWGYKVTSLGVHLFNAWLIFLLARRLLSLATAVPWSRWAPFAIALFWAVHPLQVSSVLYIVQRMETLSLTFVLLGLLAYLRGRVRQIEGQRGLPWLVAAVVLSLLGLLSKETAILFPAYFLALELTILSFASASASTAKRLRGAYGAGAALAVLLFAFVVLPHYTATGYFDGRNFTWDQRLLTQLRVLPMYLGQMLLPLPGTMTFYYDEIAVSQGWLSPATTLLGGLLLAVLLASAIWLRRRMPLYALGVFWFFAAHILTSNVIPLELAFEHRNYFALLGIALALADLLHHIPVSNERLKPLIATVMIVGLGLLACIRSAVWGDPFTLALDLVQRNPQSARASSDLATLYVAMSGGNADSPFFKSAAQEFERASLLPSASPLPEQGLILMHATVGKPVNDEWWTRLIQKVKTRPISPQESMAVTGLLKQRYEGIALNDHRLGEALQALLHRGKSPAYLYAQTGDFALRYLKDENLANRMFMASIERHPQNGEYANKVISTLLSEGHHQQASLVTDRAVQLGLIRQPLSPRAHATQTP